MQTLIAIIALAVLAGLCFLLLAPRLLTRERTGDVSGKVTYAGKPIPWGRVTFVGQDGDRKAVSAPIKNGRYEVKNCPTGKVKISFESFLARKVAGPPGKQRGLTKDFKGTSPVEVIGQRLAIPPEYGNADTSGQEYEVGRGAQGEDHRGARPLLHGGDIVGEQAGGGKDVGVADRGFAQPGVELAQQEGDVGLGPEVVGELERQSDHAGPPAYPL